MKKIITILCSLILLFCITASFGGCANPINNLPNDANISIPCKVGDICPNFLFDWIYDSAGAKNEKGDKYDKLSIYTESENILCAKGKVTILYYWHTICDPCIVELPYLEKIKDLYGDNINMAAICVDVNKTEVQAFIDSDEANSGNLLKKESWHDWDIIFTTDTFRKITNDKTEYSYTILGGKGIYPMTVILNSNGIVTYINHGLLGHTENETINVLIQEIDKAEKTII